MDNLNSKAKGDSFEYKVYKILNNLIDNDLFYVARRNSKVFWKKSYYSELRKSKIIVDISIESYFGDSLTPSIITIVECKNYATTRVPIDDLEEFSSKLEQIGRHNTKGLLISNSHFQKSSIEFAKSTSIGLARIKENNKLDWINHRLYKGKNNEISLNNRSVETKLESRTMKRSFVSLYKNRSFFELPGLLIDLGVIDKFVNLPFYLNLPYRNNQIIEKHIITHDLYKYSYNGKINLEELCSYLTHKHNVDFNFSANLGYSNDKKVLGKISFNPLEISISEELVYNSSRWRFTLAHEIGHFILHYDDLIHYFNEYFDDETALYSSLGISDLFYNKNIEIQANIFASLLLMPQFELIQHVKDYFEYERIYKGFLFLDSQACNIGLTMKLLNELESKFGVSKEAAKIRLKSQNLLKEQTIQSIKDII